MVTTLFNVLKLASFRSTPTAGIPGLLLCLKLAVCLLFAGRGWLYISGLSPLSTFFWREAWLAGPVESMLGISWSAYTRYSEPLIIQVQTGLGFFFLLAAACTWLCGRKRALPNAVILSAWLLLLPHGLLTWVGMNYSWALLLEYFVRALVPLLLITADGRWSTRSWYYVAAIASAATFIGHGIYAWGWPYPRPASFSFMTMDVLGLGQAASGLFLCHIAVIDFMAAAGLFIRRTQKYAALYMVAWGLLTALARPLAHFTPAENFYGLHPWIAESLVRMPHALLPVACYLIIRHGRR
mgnify:CR=1 FL=1